ncbi:ATP-binding protein [Gulosibacter bifidus]|uniref:ATP-binding protein n=1 Tax=Gulosibacter bifidus TaxID=272239 RepID=A0ABW5RI45_9MICO|nr:ATP-binding protein [Gulosibacter bifidus]
MWGIFRKRDNDRADGAHTRNVPESSANETEPILDRENTLEEERDLVDGVGKGERPSDWIDQVRATRAGASDTAFAPPADDDRSEAPESEPITASASDAASAQHDIDLSVDDMDDAPGRDNAHAAESANLTDAGDVVDDAPFERPETIDERVAHERWRNEVAALGGKSPQLYFSGRRGTYIDLSTAHPSGIALLLARRPVMLSSLLREPLTFRNALDAAGHITRLGAELEAARGLNTIQLAAGFATWTGTGGIERNAPIFLRQASLRRLGRDYEIRLRGKLQPNVALLRAMYHEGATLRASELMQQVEASDALLPEAAFAYVREAGRGLSGFTVDSIAALSTFADFADAMYDDLGTLDQPIVRALAGNAGARDFLGRPIRAEQAIDPDHRDPSSDRLLLDADTQQERVVDAILGGSNLVVETLPGTGVTQTVVNAIGQLLDRNRRVLVVTPRTASVRTIRARLKHVGLEGVAVTPRTLRRDIIAGITRNERAERPNTAELDDALVRLRRVLSDYRAALATKHESFGVSPLDALEALSQLELLEVPPSTTARLRRDELDTFAEVTARAEAGEQLRELGELGQFRLNEEDSPWFGVAFGSTDEVSEVYGTAVELADGRVTEFLDETRKIVQQTNLREPETFTELGIYLRLLADIRETLDRFTPEVFDADLAELIEATGGRREGSDMPSARRRELRQLAREFVRPGVTVNELHESLKYVQRQRILWHRYVQDAAQPSVPIGIDTARDHWRDLSAKIQLVDGPFEDVGHQTLATTPLDELESRIARLAAKSEVLDNAVDRLALNERLTARGLGDLITDLAERHIEPEHVADELELAWWQSVLEELLVNDKALLNANTRVVTRLESDFRVVDEAHTASTASQIAWQLAEAWKVALVDGDDQAETFRQLLRSPGTSSRQLVNKAPSISEPLTQVWLASPYDVHRIDERITFDTVLLVDAGAFTTAEAIGAIRRANQVVAFGDPVTQFPTPFEVAVQPPMEAQRVDAKLSKEDVARLTDDSIYASLAEFLPGISLTRSYRAGGEDLTELVNERFYDGRLDSMPWAGAFLGHSSLTYSYVPNGTGMPDPRTGAVEATDAEVTRVIELVLDHAIHRPRESLMVVSASAAHAQRVEQAVWSAVSHRADVAEFFMRPRNEPFVVTTIEGAAAQSRDRVIFSLGYGVTPHGRVLSEFGVLAGPLGTKSLAVTMSRARRSLVIVSCIRPEQLDLSRLTPGVLQLCEILTELDERDADARLASPAQGNASADAAGAVATRQRRPMLVDLGRRLESFGMRVELDYRGRIPLAASYGHRAIVVDMEAVGRGESDQAVKHTLRETLRLRPELLKRLGWYYLRVHAFELFANPEAVAQRIATALEVPIGDQDGETLAIEAAPKAIAEREAPRAIEPGTSGSNLFDTDSE